MKCLTAFSKHLNCEEDWNMRKDALVTATGCVSAASFTKSLLNKKKKERKKKEKI